MEDIAASVDEMRRDIGLLKSQFLQVNSKKEIPANTASENSSATPSTDVLEDRETSSGDDSVVTVDEDVPDLTSEEYLNSYVQTTRLNQLRH